MFLHTSATTALLAMAATVSRPFTSCRPRASIHHQAPARRGAVVVRACWRSNLAAGLAGVALVLSGVAPPAHAATPVIEEALEQEETLQVQSKQLEYIMQQQSLAKKAQIEAERQRLSLKRTSVENAIQQKLIEQRASALSAKAKGDENRAKESEAEAAQLEETAEKIKVAAAKIEAQLSRAEMLEKARQIAGQQSIRKALQEADYNINLAVDRELEAKVSRK